MPSIDSRHPAPQPCLRRLSAFMKSVAFESIGARYLGLLEGFGYIPMQHILKYSSTSLFECFFFFQQTCKRTCSTTMQTLNTKRLPHAGLIRSRVASSRRLFLAHCALQDAVFGSKRLFHSLRPPRQSKSWNLKIRPGKPVFIYTPVVFRVHVT